MKTPIEKDRKLSLEDKEKHAKMIIIDSLDNSKNPHVLFDGRVESLVILHLLKQLYKNKIIIPALYIDTTLDFEEIYNYIEKMRKLWGFRLIREIRNEALNIVEIAEDEKKCCELYKNDMIRDSIEKYNIGRLYAGEETSEQFMAYDQNIITYPTKDFSDEDVWKYITKYNIPCCSLYEKGYNNIKCVLCTVPIKTNGDQIENQDEEEIKKRLKALGYI